MSETNQEMPEAVLPALPVTSWEDSEAAFDEYLQSVDPIEDEGDEPADLEALRAAAPTEVEKTETPEADQAQGTEEQPESEEATGGDLESSLAALRRDGLPQAVIDKMTNEEVLALGAKRAKVQGDTDNTYRELQELKSGKEIATESNEDSTQAPAPTEQPSVVDLKTAIEPFVETFGEEAGESLEKALNATVQPVLAQFKAQQDMLEGMLLASSRQNLTDKYPSLSEDEAYARVSTRMTTLVKSGEYQDINTLMGDAARLEFADETADASKRFQTKLERDKAGGRMMPTGTKDTPQTSMTDDEREDALLHALDAGMSVDEAKRLYGTASAPFQI